MFGMFNLPFAQMLIASVIAGIMGISGFILGTSIAEEAVEVTIEPTSGTSVVGETFVTTVVVRSDIPVNAFKGLLHFDKDKLAVESIAYNTSIADLWAEEPWYSNGEGTINFTGGTTIKGGFVGEGTLITVTFTAKSPGEASVHISDMQVLQHDGLGTEAELAIPIDSIFSVESEQQPSQKVLATDVTGPKVTIIPKEKNRDLNGDGKQTVADISVFMVDMLSKNPRSDLNEDGIVNLTDLSILTQ